MYIVTMTARTCSFCVIIGVIHSNFGFFTNHFALKKKIDASGIHLFNL